MAPPTQWYYIAPEGQVGPVPAEEFAARVEAGDVTPRTLVWTPGLEGWLPRETVDLETGQPVPHDANGRVACGVCGTVAPAGEAVLFLDAFVCGDCKPIYMQRLREAAPVAARDRYAGFWVRLAAKIIDWLLLGLVGLLLYLVPMALLGTGTEDPITLFVAQMIGNLAQFGIAIAYTTYFTGAYGGTPGKRVLGLRVVTANFERVSYLRAFARYWAEVLSGLVFYIGYIIAAFDDEKRALHDHICGTRVVFDEEVVS